LVEEVARRFDVQRRILGAISKDEDILMKSEELDHEKDGGRLGLTPEVEILAQVSREVVHELEVALDSAVMGCISNPWV
jgi:hypothetical protein